jgi:hypothetical protein
MQGPSVPENVAACSCAEGRLDLFTIVDDGGLWQMTFVNGAWGGWQQIANIGSKLQPPAVANQVTAVSYARGRIDLFFTDGQQVWHMGYDERWYGPESIGSPPIPSSAGSSPIIPPVGTSRWGTDGIDVFVLGTDGNMWHSWFDGDWYDWESLAPGNVEFEPYLSSPFGGAEAPGLGATSWSPGRIDVFAINTAGLIHAWHDVPQNSAHSKNWGWEDLAIQSSAFPFEHMVGVEIATPTAAAWGPGRLDIFLSTTDEVAHKWYDGQSGWHDWESLTPSPPYIFGPPSVASWGLNRLDVFVPASGTIWQLTYDDTPNHQDFTVDVTSNSCGPTIDVSKVPGANTSINPPSGYVVDMTVDLDGGHAGISQIADENTPPGASGDTAKVNNYLANYDYHVDLTSNTARITGQLGNGCWKKLQGNYSPHFHRTYRVFFVHE